MSLQPAHGLAIETITVDLPRILPALRTVSVAAQSRGRYVEGAGGELLCTAGRQRWLWRRRLLLRVCWGPPALPVGAANLCLQLPLAVLMALLFPVPWQ